MAATTTYPTFPHDNLANPPEQANQPEDDEEPPPTTAKKIIFHRLLHSGPQLDGKTIAMRSLDKSGSTNSHRDMVTPEYEGNTHIGTV
ncbi:hypothetical protein [Luteibacter sahnii]|uniref:hypothetical protein n=1 Tax=Luteibacter sahnii TaxID=3021977 RepID=UPI002A75647C|nr:hypothetical protein [Luteibacter sp. PPL193]MDY1550165.1 hypothetical protein [Luteibacter sp. PPL193]